MESPTQPRSHLADYLLVFAGVAAIIAAVVVALGHDGSRIAAVTERSVDAGFTRDMIVHHDQAVLMASYTRDHAPTPEIRLLATSIDEGQSLEVGHMLGWLDGWGLRRTSDLVPMSWMGSGMGGIGGMSMPGADASPGGVLMPGMASPAELDALVNMTGQPLEVRFLQLMIRHHRGGLPMARYAALHAQAAYVRQLAEGLVLAQTSEIDQMSNLLTARGGTPLPPPA